MMETVKAALLAEYSVGQWVMVFFLYSFAGWCWEVALYLVKERRFVNRGFLSGPILPIYGFGALSILLTCVPFKENVLAVAVIGTVTASLLEYVTGALMEALFHVRYWDYSNQPLNLNGHICLLSAVTWAVFSAAIVCGVHPLFQPYVALVPSQAALALSGTLSAFAVIDTVAAVRRALDLRALLESMERYARELESLHGGLDSISDRVGDMVRAFAGRVDAKQEELAAGVERITSARDRVKQMMTDKRISLEEGARERFAGFERILSEVAAFLPDTAGLREEIAAAKEKYDRQSEALRAARQERLGHAERVLRANPGAVSARHSVSLAILKREQEENARERRAQRQARRTERKEERAKKRQG